MRLVVDPAVVEMALGATGSIAAKVYDTTGAPLPGALLVWSTSDSTVAGVPTNGVVRGLSVGNTTLMVSSNGLTATAMVRITPPPPADEAITIYPELTYQVMHGWEGTAQLGEVECHPIAFRNYRDRAVDRLVNELGVNRVRLETRSGQETTHDWYTPYTLSRNIVDWGSHRYESINDNDDPDVANPAGFQFAELTYVTDSVVEPLRRVLEARGEKLLVTLTYVDFRRGQWEHSSDPREYAELIVESFKHLRQRYGWVPDAVEVILEPDNGVDWPPIAIGKAIVATGDRLRAEGFTPEFVAPATKDMSLASEYLDQMIAVPRVLEYLTDISYHRYAGVSRSALGAIADRARRFGLRTAMLEHIGADYHELHEDIRDGRVSTWEQYVLGGCRPDDNGGKYYLFDPSNLQAPAIHLASRSRYLRQYFTYIRYGAVRVGATSGDGRIDPLAFRNANGKLVIVAKASAGMAVEVRRLPPGVYGITWTTVTESYADQPDVVVGSSGVLQLHMPAAGVVTIHQR